MSDEPLKVLSYAEELFPHLPVFQRLTHLQLCIAPVYVDDRALQSILKNLPLLDCHDFGNHLYNERQLHIGFNTSLLMMLFNIIQIRSSECKLELCVSYSSTFL